MLNNIKKYYTLTKPGIIYGNLLSTIAGFFLASKLHPNFILLGELLFGVACIIASACVWNNLLDRNIDKKMKRTQYRPLVTKRISPLSASLYASILGLIGFMILIRYTNWITVFAGFTGNIVYVIVYSIAKRTTIWNTIIGSISGAMPIVAGYTAVMNRIDIGVILLFLILACWQMPHFYAIAIFRLSEYTNAGLILWPIKKGIRSTQIQILIFLLGFIFSSLLLFFYGYKGILFFLIILALGSIWLWKWIQGLLTQDTYTWGRGMFFFSLIALLVTCITIALPI